MKVLCAWCRKDLGEKPGCDDLDFPVTHGICAECADRMRGEDGMGLSGYLDSLPAPVALVDSDGVVESANRRLCAMLGKELFAIRNKRAGNVFECAHARLPEGCGHTIHCSGCAIRRTVMETFESGKARTRVPACLDHDTPSGLRQEELFISTEKVGRIVLLRIDGP